MSLPPQRRTPGSWPIWLLLVAAVGCLGILAAACEGRSRPLPPTPQPNPSASNIGGQFDPGLGGGGEGGGVELPDPDAPCDTDLDVDDPDPLAAAAAAELCKQAEGPDDWGVVSAHWVLPDGAPFESNTATDLGHGILDGFGAQLKVLAGERLLALSSGTARQPGDPGYQTPAGFDKGISCESPEGFPKESPSCPAVVTGACYDGIGLELELRAPSEANGFAFDFSFFTYEWPVYICSIYNDFFVALLDPTPPGQDDGNISFDQLGNPVSVNNAFVRVCDCPGGPPCQAPPESPVKTYDCELGDADLASTGFESHAATGWLVTRAPVAASATITLRWTVYDSGDGILDSTTIIDNFRWLGAAEQDPSTKPVPK